MTYVSYNHMIKGNQPTETLEENWPFACLLCHNCGEHCKNTLCQISPLPSAAICGHPRSKEAKPLLKLQIDGHSYRQHIIQGRNTWLSPAHIFLYFGFKESLGNAWIQTNGQEKLRDRKKHITFCENSALQNARASSNFNPAPYTPKHNPPVLWEGIHMTNLPKVCSKHLTIITANRGHCWEDKLLIQLSF